MKKIMSLRVFTLPLTIIYICFQNAVACEHGLEGIVKVQSRSAPTIQATVDTETWSIEVNDERDAAHPKKIWSMDFNIATEGCRVGEGFTAIHLLEEGKTVVGICDNYHVSELNDRALMVVKKDGQRHSFRVSDFTSALFPDDERGEDLATLNWLRSIEIPDDTSIIITGADMTVRTIDLATIS